MGEIFTAAQTGILRDKLDPSAVRTRSQAGQQLSYIEAWHAIDRANEIFGFGAWDRETVLLQETVRETYAGKSGGTMTRVGYLAKVRITVRGIGGEVVREGTGHGQGTGSDPTMAVEGAVKEAESDAMKRALMTFGNPFGLALYDKAREDVGTPDHVIAEEVRKEVAAISAAQVEELRNLLAATSSDPARFIAAFQLSSLEGITEAQFPMLRKALLDKREKLAAAKKGAA